MFRFALKYFLVAFLPLVMSACYFAPGMYLGERSKEDGTVDTLAVFHGAEVHLQSITPATLVSMIDTTPVKFEIPKELLEKSEEPYRLGKFDIVQICVWENQQLPLPLASYRGNNTVEAKLDENGEIFFPYVGQFKAAGMTLTELRDVIEKGISAALNDPKIEVHLQASQSQKAFIQGAGALAGVIPISDQPISLLEALNNRGGVSSDDTTRVTLIRNGITYDINMRYMYPLGEGPNDIILQDGDIIRVSGDDKSKVFVLGEVNRQSSVPIINGDMTLSQALAEVGGIQTLSAQSRGIYVIRGDLQHIDVYHLNSRNPMALVFGDQFKLKPHDIVFVDATGVARWNRVMSQILPSVQSFYYGMQTIHLMHSVKGDLENW